MTTKKLIQRQAHLAEFLSGFNFVFSYLSVKKNQKADSFTGRANNFLSNDNNNCKQHLLQSIFPAKRLEIISIEKKDNNTINNQVI